MQGSIKGIRCFLGVRGGVRMSELVNLRQGEEGALVCLGPPPAEGLGPESGCGPTLPALPIWS